MAEGDRSYSPGPALVPIDHPRAPRWLAPMLAAVALVVIVGAVAFAITRARGGDDQRDSLTAAQSVTRTAVANEEPTTSATKSAKATAAPTEEGETGAVSDTPDEEAEPSPTRGASSSEGDAPSSARSLLPATSALPEGFSRTEDDQRSIDQTAANFADPEEAKANLEEWGWEENRYRTFQIPEESAGDPAATNFINVSVHRFGDTEGVASAMTYFVDAVVAAQGLEPFEVEQIGDETIALKGSPDGATLTVLYIRDGDFLIRIGGSSPQADPTQDVVDLANKIVG